MAKKFQTLRDKMSQERLGKIDTMTKGLHTAEQLKTKRKAVEIATRLFVMNYSEGFFERNDSEFLYHAIESLNQLVVELKRDDNV